MKTIDHMYTTHSILPHVDRRSSHIMLSMKHAIIASSHQKEKVEHVVGILSHKSPCTHIKIYVLEITIYNQNSQNK